MRFPVTTIVVTIAFATLLGCTGIQRDGKENEVETVRSAIVPDETTPIGQKWRELINRGINLGEATAAVQSIPGGAAQYQTFAGAVIVYSNDYGATLMPLNIFNRWLAAQSETDAGGNNLFFVLGLPTGDYVPSPGHDDCTFEHGVIVLIPGVARIVYGDIYLRYLSLAGRIGLPVTEEQPTNTPGGGRRQVFSGGDIYWRGDIGPVGILGTPILSRHHATGGVLGPLGFPKTDTETVVDAANTEIGQSSRFENGTIFYSPASGAYEVTDPILVEYENRFGGPAGWLGFPISPTGTSGVGDRFNDFQGGVLVNRGGTTHPFGELDFHLTRAWSRTGTTVPRAAVRICFSTWTSRRPAPGRSPTTTGSPTAATTIRVSGMGTATVGIGRWASRTARSRLMRRSTSGTTTRRAPTTTWAHRLRATPSTTCGASR
jgi:uncharacterized protein with LGFP repeats